MIPLPTVEIGARRHDVSEWGNREAVTGPPQGLSAHVLAEVANR